jgi:pantoate--beta-alanine ligase
MRTVETVDDMRKASLSVRAEGRRIGLVPTMGAFHEGHLSLMQSARAENDLVVVSLFVNPTQFGPEEDLDRYPRTLGRDIELAQGEGVDILFLPHVEEIYPEGYCTQITVKGLSERLCGESRPGHFQGVATVVAKLFNITLPHRAYFGLKDYQQSVVIRRMAQDLNFDLDIVTLPTVREPDGLAMSSRNAYLSEEEHQAALCLKESLDLAAHQIREGERSADPIRGSIRERIGREKLARIDYVSVSDPNTLNEISTISGEVLIALAVKIGETRLIDNLLVRP